MLNFQSQLTHVVDIAFHILFPLELKHWLLILNKLLLPLVSVVTSWKRLTWVLLLPFEFFSFFRLFTRDVWFEWSFVDWFQEVEQTVLDESNVIQINWTVSLYFIFHLHFVPFNSRGYFCFSSSHSRVSLLLFLWLFRSLAFFLSSSDIKCSFSTASYKQIIAKDVLCHDGSDSNNIENWIPQDIVFKSALSCGCLSCKKDWSSTDTHEKRWKKPL